MQLFLTRLISRVASLESVNYQRNLLLRLANYSIIAPISQFGTPLVDKTYTGAFATLVYRLRLREGKYSVATAAAKRSSASRAGERTLRASECGLLWETASVNCRFFWTKCMMGIFRNSIKNIAYSIFARPTIWIQENYLPAESNEAIYMQLFNREIEKAGIPDIFYPINGAASYSLLFHFIKFVGLFDKPRILELGAGQSSMLISSLIEKGIVFEAITIEENAIWAKEIGKRVKQRVVHAPLIRRSVKGRICLDYEYDIPKDKEFDIILIDGPTGELRWSRFCSVRFLDTLNISKFAVFFDDTHRIGEKDTLWEAKRIIKSDQKTCSELTVRSSKHSTILYRGVNLASVYVPGPFERS